MRWVLFLYITAVFLTACSSVSLRKNELYDRQHVFELTSSKVLRYPKNAIADRGPVVLVYHRIGDKPGHTTNINPVLFAEQIKYIINSEFSVLPLEQMVADLAIDQTPDKSVAITFDDAYASIFDKAHPLLAKNKIPYTIFVSTSLVGRPGYMSWAQLRYLAENSLVTIGNHGHRHFHFVNDGKIEDVRRDIIHANNLIAEKLGRVPLLLSYPFGEYSNATKDLVKNLGFKAAFTQLSGAVGPESDPFALPRFATNDFFSQMHGTEKTGFEFRLYALPFSSEVIEPRDTLVNSQTELNEVVIRGPEQLSALDDLNCYFNGRAVKHRKSDELLTIAIDSPLDRRRSHLTCTLLGAPSSDGAPLRFHWQSYLFINPSYTEVLEN